MEVLLCIGQPFMEFAYEALPARRDTRVKFALDFLAMQLGLAICCIAWCLFLCGMLPNITSSVEVESGQCYQVEVTGVEATDGFPGPQDMTMPSSSSSPSLPASSTANRTRRYA